MNLNMTMRHELVDLLINRKYEPLIEENKTKLRRSTQRYLYRFFGKENNQMIPKLKGTPFVGTCSSVYVPTVNEKGRTRNTYVEFKKALPVPAMHSGSYNYVEKAFDSNRKGSPRYYAEKEIRIGIERKELKADLILKLKGFRTVEKLKKDWPEIIPDLNTVLAEHESYLPMIVDNSQINKKLGLPPKE